MDARCNFGAQVIVRQDAAHKPSEHAEEHAHESARMSWARLLKRVFKIDVEHCPQCGGDLKIIAAIEDPAVIVRILTHLRLRCARATAFTGAPARPVSGGLTREKNGSAIGGW